MDLELQALQRLNYDTDAPNWDLLSQKLSSASSNSNSNKNASKSETVSPDIQRNTSYFLSKIAELEDELRAERANNSKLKLSAESMSIEALTPQKDTPRDDNDSNLSDMITKLKDENSTLITRLDASKNTNLSLKSLITATEANCKAKVSELEEKYNNKEKQYSELKQKCDSLTAKYSNSKNKVVQLENDIQILKASVNENDSKKTIALENEIKELQTKIEELQSNNMNMEDEKIQLSQQLEDLKSSIQEVLTINKKQESTLATQAQTIESLQSIIQSLKQKAEDRNEKCKILQHYGIEKRNEIAQQSIIVNSFNERIRLYESHLMSYEDMISQEYELQCLKSELELLKAAEDNARSSVMKGWMEYLDMPPPTGIQFEDKAVTAIFETWSDNPTRRSQLTRWFNTCHTIENLSNDRGLELTGLTPEVANGFLLIILPELRSLLKDTSNLRIFTREKVIRQMDLRISISESDFISPTFTSFHKTVHETEDEPIIVRS